MSNDLPLTWSFTNQVMCCNSLSFLTPSSLACITSALQAVFNCYRRVVGDLCTIFHHHQVVQHLLQTPGVKGVGIFRGHCFATIKGLASIELQ